MLIPRLLDLYSHEKPLVRSITCFAMQHFICKPMKQVKDPYPKMLRCTPSLLRDKYRMGIAFILSTHHTSSIIVFFNNLCMCNYVNLTTLGKTSVPLMPGPHKSFIFTSRYSDEEHNNVI